MCSAFCLQIACIFCKFPSVFLFLQLSQRSCQEIANVRKNAKTKCPSRTCCKSNAKKMQKKNKFKMQNEPAIQKNANQSCKKKQKQTFPNPCQGRALMKLSPIGILLEDVTDQQIIGIIDDNMVEIPKHWDIVGIIWA